MTKNIYYINDYTVIRGNKIIKNGNVIFETSVDGVDFLMEAYEFLQVGYPKFYKMDILSKSGMIAADVLLKQKAINNYKADDVGIILSNCNASLQADVNYLATANTFPSPSLFVYTLPNIVIGEISIRYHFKGESAFFISEQFDAAWICFYVQHLLETKKIKACLCGWVEAMNEEIDVCVFWVDGNSTETSIPFTEASLKQIYNQNY